MNFDIAHLSDLHFGNPKAHLSRKDVSNALDAVLAQLNAPASFLIISGDITFQGNQLGYDEAAVAITSAIERRKMSASNVFVCPGNHDIVIEKSGFPYFTSFDVWSTKVRSDKSCTFANSPARLIENQIGDFLLINTAHHADHKMGLVDLVAVKKVLKNVSQVPKSTPPRLRLAVLHHHIIPVLSGDTSTTQNAYELIGLLDKHGFSAVLHGHQHAMLNLMMGQNKMLLSGVGSFGYLTAGYMNSVAIYRGQEGVIESVERYGLTLDSSTGIVQILKPN